LTHKAIATILFPQESDFLSPHYPPKIGKQAMDDQVSAYSNVETPAFGADWQLCIQLQFLFPK